eukprot:185528-Pyramimonas_sp.AAC.1
MPSQLKRGISSTSLGGAFGPDTPNKKFKGLMGAPLKIENEHRVGTPQYWITELNLHMLFDGAKLGKQEAQAKLLLPKLPPSERNGLRVHMDLVEHAKKMNNVHALSDQELRDAWQPFAKLGMLPTPKLALSLVQRRVDSLWRELHVASRVEKVEGLCKQLLECLRIWSEQSGARFDVFDPKLISTGGTDAEIADFFVKHVFTTGIGHWISQGAAMEMHVQEFALVAGTMWSDLPEDADLGHYCALVLLDARAAMRIIRSFLVAVIDDTTDIEIFQEYPRFEQEALRTTGYATPTQALGQALNATSGSYWRQQFERLKADSDKIQELGPSIADAISKVMKQPAQISQATIKELRGVCEKIPYWEQQVNDQICIKLRAGIIKKVSWMAEELLNKKRKLEQKDSCTEEDERTVLMHGMKDLLRHVATIDPLSEEIARWASKLADALQDMDKGVKMGMVSEAILAWTPTMAEHTHRLRDAIGACKPNSVSGKVENDAYKLLQSIANDLGQKANFGNGTEAHIYDAVEMLAEICPKDFKRDAEAFSAWLKSAWRLECVTESVRAKVPDSQGNHNDLDKLARELSQALQRVLEKNMPSGLVAKFSSTLSEREESTRKTAKELVMEIGEKVRDHFYDGVQTKSQKLHAEIDQDAWAKAWVTGKAGVEELALLLEVGAHDRNSSLAVHWGDLADSLQSEFATLLQKTVDFELAPKADIETTLPELIRTARVLHLEHSLIGHFTNEATKRDKILLRARMRDIQGCLKEWSLTPEDFPTALIARYRAGLRMT